jgi:hypothetical protein
MWDGLGSAASCAQGLLLKLLSKRFCALTADPSGAFMGERRMTWLKS